MMKHKWVIVGAIALLLVLSNGFLRAAYAERSHDFTRIYQSQPECKGDRDDCE
jgi:hypothetical protein